MDSISGKLPRIDSVLSQSDRKLFIIQATIAPKHRSPKERIDGVWAALHTDTCIRCKWHVVIVTDSTEAAQSFVEMILMDSVGF